MITNQQAIARLRERDKYLVSKIETRIAECKSNYWLEIDRQAISLAIASLEFTIATLEYEQSQKEKTCQN